MARARATYLCVRTSESAIAAAVLSRACGSPARSYIAAFWRCILGRSLPASSSELGLLVYACARKFSAGFCVDEADAFVFEWRADSFVGSLTPPGKEGRAQTASLLTHSGIIGGACAAGLSTRTSFHRSENGGIDVIPGHLLFSPPSDILQRSCVARSQRRRWRTQSDSGDAWISCAALVAAIGSAAIAGQRDARSRRASGDAR